MTREPVLLCSNCSRPIDHEDAVVTTDYPPAPPLVRHTRCIDAAYAAGRRDGYARVTEQANTPAWQDSDATALRNIAYDIERGLGGTGAIGSPWQIHCSKELNAIADRVAAVLAVLRDAP